MGGNESIFYYLSCMNVFHENQKTGKSSHNPANKWKIAGIGKSSLCNPKWNTGKSPQWKP